MSKPAQTRASLLIRVRDSEDALAWNEFVEIYAPLVHAYVMNRGMQDADAADLTQEVLQAFASRSKEFQYDPSRGSFRGWLFTVTLNKLRDYVTRREKRERASGKSEVQGLLEQHPDDAEEIWNQHHQWRLFTWAADKVRPDFRENSWRAFWSTSVENQSPREVADRLGMSVGAVHIARSRVLARIKGLLESVEKD